MGLLVQSSNKATVEQFDVLKNSLSEVVGRLKVGPNQVHVGYMQYSQRTRTYSSVRMTEQGQVSFVIDRLQDLFFVPFEFSPVADALTRSVSEIFRDSSRTYRVPRVALFINDAASNPKADLTSAAKQLASEQIEVIALGIGNSVDVDELKVATNQKEENLIHLSSYESLYQNLDVIVQKICSLNVEVFLNKLDYQRLGRFDYRYFRTSLASLKSSFIEIQVEELQANNKVNFYYSFDIKNPVKENSGKLESTRQALRVLNQSVKYVSNYYLIYVPTGKAEIYFTLESLDRSADVNVYVNEIDF